MSAESAARLGLLLSGEESRLPLDETSLLVAAQLIPGVDVPAELGRLDALAERVGEPGLAGLLHHLFRVEGFRGNRTEYGDPANSLLNQVLDRRLGIPISLSILTVEVGRRVGIPLVGVGLPGHFLVRDAADSDLFVDPFSGGVILDTDACRRLVAHLHGTEVGFDLRWLDPVGAWTILARSLANLKRSYLITRDRRSLSTVLRIRQLIPSVPASERAELAEVLAADGRFDQAARELDGLADQVDALPDTATGAPAPADLRAKATRLRARLN